MKTQDRILTVLCSILTLLAVSTACTKQLDTVQNGAVSQDVYYTSDEGAEAAIASVYAFWRYMYYDFIEVLDVMSDDSSVGGAGGGSNTLTALNDFTYSSENTLIETLYTDFYSLIYYANVVLDNVSPETDVKKRCVAEAKFFRAWAHFYLGALWGETVPVVDHVLQGDDRHVTRSEAGVLWSLVESDLTAAVSVLPSKKSLDDKTMFRVSKEAAETMLGKAYLWQGKNSEAAAQFEAVISSGKYALWTGPDNPSGLDDARPIAQIMHFPANTCCEKVLEIIIPDDLVNYRTNAAHKASQFFQEIGFPHTRFDIEDLSLFNIYARSGGDMFPPTRSLWDAFVAEEGPDGERFNQTLITVEGMAEIGFVLQKTTDREDHDMYFNWKNRPLMVDKMSPDPNDAAADFKVNVPMIRYAEVLLLASEAQLTTGNSAKALQYLNMVRTRAGLPEKSSITLDDIKTEKRLELCFEGQRYMDLVRWGDAEKVLADAGKTVYGLRGKMTDPGYEVYVLRTEPNAGFKSRNKIFPIPEKELFVNSKMEQSEGW